jgi:hypothetical protein
MSAYSKIPNTERDVPLLTTGQRFRSFSVEHNTMGCRIPKAFASGQRTLQPAGGLVDNV